MKTIILAAALVLAAQAAHAQVSCNTFGTPTGWTGSCDNGTSWQTITTPNGTTTNIDPPRQPVPLPRSTGPLSQPGVAGQRGLK